MERKMNAPKNKTPFRLPLRVYLSYLLILTLIFTAVSFAKFATSGGGGDNARVASYAVSAVGADDTSLDIKFTETTGTKLAAYAIDVYNTEGSKVSEVAISYDIVVTVDGTLPNGVTITVDGKTASTVSGSVYTFSDVGAIPGGAAGSATHTLTLTGDSSKIYTDLTGENSIDFNISVNFEQID